MGGHFLAQGIRPFVTTLHGLGGSVNSLELYFAIFVSMFQRYVFWNQNLDK